MEEFQMSHQRSTTARMSPWLRIYPSYALQSSTKNPRNKVQLPLKKDFTVEAVTLIWRYSFTQTILNPIFLTLKCSECILKVVFLEGYTPWILALKWHRQNMSLEKIYFAPWIRRKLGKKEFLKSHIVLLRAELNSTIDVSWMGQSAGAS